MSARDRIPQFLLKPPHSAMAPKANLLSHQPVQKHILAQYTVLVASEHRDGGQSVPLGTLQLSLFRSPPQLKK